MGRRVARKAQVAKEQKAMQAALKRDERKCRKPRCTEAKRLDLPIDPCHMKDKHRGMGGNPAGDRTQRQLIISLCRIDHGAYDRGDLWIEPLTADDFDGPCEFHEKHLETGKFQHIGTEKRMGVSTERGR